MFNTVYGKTLSLDELRKIAAGLTKSAALRRIEEAEADDEEEDGYQLLSDAVSGASMPMTPACRMW